MASQFDEKSYSSALTLSSAVDLVSATLAKTMGNDISTTINGERATDTMVETIAANRILDNLSKK